jgi:hypothetical protein
LSAWLREDRSALDLLRANDKPSPDTEAAVREVMIAAGLTPPRVVTGKNR